MSSYGREKPVQNNLYIYYYRLHFKSTFSCHNLFMNSIVYGSGQRQIFETQTILISNMMTNQ